MYAFSLQLLSKILGRTERNIVIHVLYIGFHSNCRYACEILKKLEFSGQFFEKSSDIKFNKNPSNESRVVPCGRTSRYMTKLIVAFRNLVNAPKNFLFDAIIN